MKSTSASAPETTPDSMLQTKLLSFFSLKEIAGIDLLANRLVRKYGVDGLSSRTLLVAYGGGKDSTYTVAFLRAVQLRLANEHGSTFMLRSATMRHAGVPKAVMENIDRVYRRLDMLEDDRVELLVNDLDQVRPFHVDLPFPESLRSINRRDILLNGHRTQGDGRPTFCNACNLNVANFFGRSAWYGTPVDAVFTGDSAEEQRTYYAWIMRLARQAGADMRSLRDRGFHGVLKGLNAIGRAYYSEIHGANEHEALDRREVAAGDVAHIPEFISIYDLVHYDLDAHRDLITGFLGFEIDELAFSFTESDCANPAVMAHLRGLKAEHVEKRSYEQGVREYVQLGQTLMAKKQIPQDLQDIVLARYSTPARIESMRSRMVQFCEEAHRISLDQSICMVFSPFVGEGLHLVDWIETQHPELKANVEDIRDILSGDDDNDLLRPLLENYSGLPIANMRHLWCQPEISFSERDTLLARVREGDPHKAAVDIRDEDGRTVSTTVISGR